jgi:hypothetical protein
MKTFVPDAVTIPTGLETEDFRIRMMTIHDVVKDYDAVMTSIDHIRNTFGPDNTWPPDDLTLEQDLIDLAWHQKEFQMRSSFAYTVMSIDESRCLGCVYVDPSEKSGFDACVTCWVRKSVYDEGLDDTLYLAIQKWIAEEWWFTSVAFPGRQISWQEWASLPE